MRILALAAVVMIAAGLLAGTASAHTIAIGTVNAGAPGSVTIWMGSYHSGSSSLEGSIQIGATTKDFTTDGTKVLALPAGLIAGSNYFYTPTATYQGNVAATGDYNSATNPTGTTENIWQGVTFTGLTAGWHTYTISGMSTVVWADWNSGSSNWTGRVFIPGSSTGVPEPGSLALLGLGLAGLGFGAHRRRRRANA